MTETKQMVDTKTMSDATSTLSEASTAVSAGPITVSTQHVRRHHMSRHPEYEVFGADKETLLYTIDQTHQAPQTRIYTAPDASGSRTEVATAHEHSKCLSLTLPTGSIDVAPSSRSGVKYAWLSPIPNRKLGVKPKSNWSDKTYVVYDFETDVVVGKFTFGCWTRWSQVEWMVDEQDKVLGLSEEDRERVAEEILLIVLALHARAGTHTNNNGGFGGNMAWTGSTAARKEM